MKPGKDERQLKYFFLQFSFLLCLFPWDTLFLVAAPSCYNASAAGSLTMQATHRIGDVYQESGRGIFFYWVVWLI
jgi:hypothetical protein